MKKRKHAPRKAKLFPTFPVPAGALPGTFAIDPDDEMVSLANAAGRDPLTEKAASIVMPLLTAKKVTPKMIRVMLEEVLRVRSEWNQPNFRATIPADRRESFLRLINAHGCTHAVGIQSYGQGSWSYSFFAPPSAVASIADSLTRGGVRQFSHVPHRRKRVLLPEFKKLMAKKTVGSTQAGLNAVRGDR